MNVTPDTNVLVRALTRDDPGQSAVAARLLLQAETLILSTASLCELVWVLRGAYKFSRLEIQAALQSLVDTDNIVIDRFAVEAGMAFVHNGGDFADGVIAFEGRSTGSDIFVSFDKKAVSLLKSQGHSAKLLS